MLFSNSDNATILKPDLDLKAKHKTDVRRVAETICVRFRY